MSNIETRADYGKKETARTTSSGRRSKKADEKRTKVLEAIQTVKDMSDKNSKWTITEEMFQDIQAGHIVVNPNQLPPITQMRQELLDEIKERYKDEPAVMQVLLDSVPEARLDRDWETSLLL